MKYVHYEAVKTDDGKFEVRFKFNHNYYTVCECYCTPEQGSIDALENAKRIARLLNENQRRK